MAKSTKSGPVRKLVFADLRDALQEAQSLHDHGYTRGGNWSLAQNLGHCQQWLEYSLDGGYPVPLFMRPIAWVVRHTIGPGMLKKVIATNSMPGGNPTFRETVPAGVAGTDNASRSAKEIAADQAAIDDLAKAIRRFEEHRGPIIASPLFGALDHTTAEALHRIHLAHHLGYLIPESANGSE